MSKHFVEVTVVRNDTDMTITNRTATGSLLESVELAEELAVKLFPEDQLTLQTFNNGVYEYWNVNDMGR